MAVRLNKILNNQTVGVEYMASAESHSMLGEHRQVIFKEDMFGVIDSAHKNGDKHRGYKGTFKKINASYCNIPREVVHKYVTMCGFCQQSHACYIPTNIRATKSSKVQLPKRKAIEPGFFARCQIDIINLQNFPDIDNGYMYIGHFFDHHTKYNVLFPLIQSDANTVAATLCQYVFGHFGLPTILHSNVSRKFVDELILWVMQFWSTDAKIFNGNPKHKDLSQCIEQRQKTILILIDTMKSKQPDFSNWSSLLPGIQYSLNTNSFEADTVPAFDLVFHRRPRVFLATNNELPEKDILREEDIFLEENREESINDKEGNFQAQQEHAAIPDQVVAFSDLISSDSSPLIISGVNNNITNTDIGMSGNPQNKSNDSQNITDGILCDLSSLRAVQCGTVNQHFSLISTNIDGSSGPTIQIPVVSIDGTGEIPQHVVLDTRQYEAVVGEPREDFQNEANDTMQLTNIQEINMTSQETLNIQAADSTNRIASETPPQHLELTNDNSQHLELANGTSQHLELANDNSVHLQLSSEEVSSTMDYDSLSIVTGENVISTDDLT